MKATCTWGEGADVIIELDGTTMILYEDATDLHRADHGFVSQGSLDLTAEEAFTLGCSICAAALHAMDWEKKVQDYFENEKKNDVIEDGFGNTWSAYCPECNKKTMQVVRPGKVQCTKCG